ncbi:baseplate J/gp47 family protein [Immundisolibacter cernigliae]|uniref:Baseplate protein J-like barrel domain-containing protein n=1 Tax=Immundisolibacter cernigliae TaxID=1810504 RepID=A0A1B1YWC5_9GAMM|nr:baseplate J/gp47 family protein [Immundisolibacter cernigliae]ANX05111.1 hypothetical protein PG2T_13600 [Immundisolibacter cernigliae]
MSFRRKTYPEVSEQLLTTLLGGVAGEAHPYPPPGGRGPARYALLAGPAAEITSVYGLAGGVSQAFARGADYALSGDGAALEWKDSARPDPGSVFEVNYLRRGQSPRVNDLYPGSVVRTLLEAVALETAGLYAQMQAVYDAGFIATATGSALDHVVALLGIERIVAGRNSTTLEFRRLPTTRGEIAIVAGTRVLTADGAIEYETLDELILADGQPSGRVAARDLVADNDGVPAGALTLLAKPIAGIEGVSNPAPSSRLDQDETDAELRLRARSFLAGAERGTPGAIVAAIARQGLRGEVSEPGPGRIAVLIHDAAITPQQQARLEFEVDQARPAGVAVEWNYGPAPVPVDLELRLVTAPGLIEADLKRIQAEVRGRVEDYFARLPLKSSGSVAKLTGLALGVAGTEDLSFVAATAGGANVLDMAGGKLNLEGMVTQLGALTLVDNALPTQLHLTVRYPNNAGIPDRATIQTALEQAAAYINTLTTAQPPAAEPLRTLTFGRMARALPLPGLPAATLAEVDAGPGPLPTAADYAPYTVQFAYTRASGLSLVQDSEAAPTLTLAAGERLAVASVNVLVKPKAGP